jgi:hypothetical protein
VSPISDKPVSRRSFSLGGLASAVVPLTVPAALVMSGSRLIGRSSGGDAFADYHPTLIDGLCPEYLIWNERKWRCAAGSTWHQGMDHSVRLTTDKARFEIRDTPFDRPSLDPATKRRAELHFAKRPRLPNEVPLWGAMSFIHHRWQDPQGMARLTGGVHGQIHIGSSFGGSPAVAFRRHGNGNFRVTTRGEQDPGNNVRYDRPLAFDKVHDLLYRVVLSPDRGSLAVWLNRQKIVDVQNASIGSHHAECHWNFGCYYGEGISCPVIAEYANLAYPGPASLIQRSARTPLWPAT